MGRMLHYQTEEGVSVGEFRQLKEVVRKYNAPRRSSGERIKLWRKSDILRCLTPADALWGFTKVHDDEERELVLNAVKEMSIATPRLTWVLYDENMASESRETIVRNGGVVGKVA